MSSRRFEIVSMLPCLLPTVPKEECSGVAKGCEAIASIEGFLFIELVWIGISLLSRYARALYLFASSAICRTSRPSLLTYPLVAKLFFTSWFAMSNCSRITAVINGVMQSVVFSTSAYAAVIFFLVLQVIISNMKSVRLRRMAVCRHVSPCLFYAKGLMFLDRRSLRISTLPLKALRWSKVEPVADIWL